MNFEDEELMRIEMWKNRFIKLWKEYPQGKGFPRGHIYNNWMSYLNTGKASMAMIEGHLKAALEIGGV